MDIQDNEEGGHHQHEGVVEVGAPLRLLLLLLLLRSENSPPNSPASRETGLEIPCCPASGLLWVQITQSYPNRLRFWILTCPESPCHTVIDPSFQEVFWRKIKLLFHQPLTRPSWAPRWGMEECSTHSADFSRSVEELSMVVF